MPAAAHPNDTTPRPVKTVRLRRTITKNVIQEWHLEVPADHDPTEWLENDEHGLRKSLADDGKKVVESRWDDDVLTVMHEGENL